MTHKGSSTNGVDSATEGEPKVRRVIVNLCELCLGGAGGECHTPGCVLWLNRGPDLALHPELIEDAGRNAAELVALHGELARIRALALKHLVAGEEINATTEALVSQLCSIADDEAMQRDVVAAAVELRKDKAPACAAGPGCCRFCTLLHTVDEYLVEKGER